MDTAIELWDYRRRVSDLYHRVRAVGVGPEAWKLWREERDRLFATHPQTPIDNPKRFEGLPYFDYDHAFAVSGEFRPGSHSAKGEFTRVGDVWFEISEKQHILPVFWLSAYGGGIFLPFKDTTNGVETYGGGRYLLDTVKGADLGGSGTTMHLDFNFSYHPSCVHSDRWVCPLARPDSTIGLDVTAGERL